MTSQEITQLREEINQGYKMLVKQHNKLPEFLFRQNFLDFFTGKVPKDQHHKYIAMWVSISGSPTARVDIVSGNNEVLFTIPGIFATVPTKTGVEKEELPMKAILEGYELHKTRLPAVGNRYLQDIIPHKLSQISITANTEEQAMWEKVFEHYGIKPAIVPVKPINTISFADYE